MSKDRKYKYGEKTVLVSGFRVPVSKVQDFKDSVYAKLDSYMNQGKTVLEEVENPETKIDLTTSFMDHKKQVGKVIKKGLPSIIPVDLFDNDKVFQAKTGYEFVDRVPFGTSPIEIIGHKLHKDNDEEIYYYKLSDGKGFKVVVLHSEKEVKDFIRKEIVK